ncbi:hypothetical protein [Vibrio chagasii]|uniref:Bbp19 family protein n=1 Tax=Vibrio chagasii TaxID=170679 RepID=UPI003DA0FBB8
MSNKEEVEAKVRKKSELFKHVFESEDGKAVLEALEEEFNRDELRGQTPQDTYFNLGRRDVLVYIKQMIRYSNKEK